MLVPLHDVLMRLDPAHETVGHDAPDALFFPADALCVVKDRDILKAGDLNSGFAEPSRVVEHLANRRDECGQ